MKHWIRKTAAAAVLVAGATLAMPVAANAATIYPPANACHTPAVTHSRVIAFFCQAGTFNPHEKVTVTVEGEDGSSTQIGVVKFAPSIARGFVNSTNDGALLALAITLPQVKSGVYTISAVSPTSAGGTASVSFTSEDTGGTGSTGGTTGSTSGTSGSSSSSGSLPVTGMDAGSLVGIWVGGGALVLAGGAAVVATSVRRNRKHAER